MNKHELHRRLLEDGFALCELGTAMAEAVEHLRPVAPTVMRDVLIGPDTSTCGLAPLQGDFWYHTDGVFLKSPPHFVVIQVLKCEAGGGFWVLDSRTLVGFPNEALRFGTSVHSIAACPLEKAPGQERVFRYRRDYLVRDAMPECCEALDQAVCMAAAEHARRLGELPSGTTLVLNNWRMLHRRETFSGDRTIRRVWLQ